MRRLLVSSALLSLSLSNTLHAAVTFSVSFDASANVLTVGERTNIDSHLQAAGKRWMQALGITATRSIEINVVINNAPTANASSVTSVFVGMIGGRNTYEQGVASELRTGVDPNAAAPDANVFIGLDYLRNELWFDPDPNARTATVPANRTDAMSVLMHEMGHVLAYSGWADLNTGQPPATYWSTFDRWMIPGQPTVIDGNNSVLAWGSAPDLTVGNINHWGNAALFRANFVASKSARIVTWNHGAPTPLPSCDLPMSMDLPAWRAGESITQIQASLINQLMNGVVFYRGSRYDISALDRGLMTDVQLLVDGIFSGHFD